MNTPLSNINIRTTSVSEWLRQRRRLQAQDRRSARLAELHMIQAVTQDAARIVLAGWTQHTWYATLEPGPATVGCVPAFDRACLVGAIVHAAGGMRSQLTQRTLRLTWHTLFRPGRPMVAWCSPPDIRAAEVRDLTQWNDSPSRRADDVVDLLHATRAAATAEARAVR
jgi:hypothetical protein